MGHASKRDSRGSSGWSFQALRATAVVASVEHADFNPGREKVSNNVVILSNNVVILINNVVILSNNDVILTLPRSFRAERTALWPVFPVAFPIIRQR